MAIDPEIFSLPPTLDEALARLSEASGQALFCYGGFLRDRALGRSSRDLDVLVHGDLVPLGDQLPDALAPHFSLKSVIPLGRTTLMIALSSLDAAPSEENPIEHLDLIDMSQFLFSRGVLGSNEAFQTAELVVKHTDFSVNAIAREIGDSTTVLSHPLWEKDTSDRTIRFLHPDMLPRELWLVFKAVRLEARLAGRIDPDSEHAIREVVRSPTWLTLLQERLTKYLYRSLNTETPWISAARLTDLGAFDQYFSRLFRPEHLERTFKAILVDSSLPAMGPDGKAPWLVASILLAQPKDSSERFLELLSAPDRTQLEVMQSHLLKLGNLP